MNAFIGFGYMLSPKHKATRRMRLRIPAQATVANIERSLREAHVAPKGEPLTLPLKLRHLGCGGEAALSQLLVTWAQSRVPARLKTYVETPNQVEELVRRLPGLTGVLCAGVIEGGGQAGDITVQAKAAVLERLNILLSGRPKSAYRGSSVEIVCADHIGRDAPYLLYQSDDGEAPRLRPRHSFASLAAWLQRYTVPDAYQDSLAMGLSDALGSMMFELFKNTEEHGQVDALGNILSMSVRAIKTIHHAIKPDDLAEIVAEDPPLAAYCQSLEPAVGATQTHLFELSVLDSGPGFAVSRTGRNLTDLSLDEEEAAVRDCFTSFSAKGGTRFGQGLPHVLKVLHKERGFLRLRTGRLSVHADFSAANASVGIGALNVYRPEHEVLAPVAGSLITVLLPLRRCK